MIHVMETNLEMLVEKKWTAMVASMFEVEKKTEIVVAEELSIDLLVFLHYSINCKDDKQIQIGLLTMSQTLISVN